MDKPTRSRRDITRKGRKGATRRSISGGQSQMKDVKESAARVAASKSKASQQSQSSVKLTSAEETPKMVSVAIEVLPKVGNSKRQICQFLEESGIKASIIRSIVSLYEEAHKPDDPVGYISRFSGYGIPTDERIGKYQAYLQKLRAQYDAAKDENAKLTAMYSAKQVEHRKMVLLQQKCAEQRQRAKHLHHRRSLLRSREKAEVEAQMKKLEVESKQKKGGRPGRPQKSKKYPGPVMKVKVPSLLPHQTHFKEAGLEAGTRPVFASRSRQSQSHNIERETHFGELALYDKELLHLTMQRWAE